MDEVVFKTFRELRDAINQIPEDKLDTDVGLTMDNGMGTIGGTLFPNGGGFGHLPWILSNGD